MSECCSVKPTNWPAVMAGHRGFGVRVWELASRRLVWGPSARGADHRHGDAVYSVAFSPDGRELVSGGYDRRNLALGWNGVLKAFLDT